MPLDISILPNTCTKKKKAKKHKMAEALSDHVTADSFPSHTQGSLFL